MKTLKISMLNNTRLWGEEERAFSKFYRESKEKDFIVEILKGVIGKENIEAGDAQLF